MQKIKRKPNRVWLEKFYELLNKEKSSVYLRIDFIGEKTVCNVGKLLDIVEQSKTNIIFFNILKVNKLMS